MRIIFTRHASPNLASQALIARISRRLNASKCECMNMEMNDHVSRPSVIASRFNKHSRKWGWAVASAMMGIITIRGRIILGIR